MSDAEAHAEALRAEFARRSIGANVSSDDDAWACNASINDIPVSVYFAIDRERGDIHWRSNTEVHRVTDWDVTADDLAERVIDTFLNPA
ncbi:hypothetical protein MMAD_02510 [Mycolicibacterium madagascariense]|uniref:Uncharacterized protein n=1 Tax=Mycolicibacterium madagascariense TaxID=212765 RepID=A0A7I7X8E0_9MYCO|nr:hypothetical protein [Mycolicibacterium madagascariense]MCV7015050.1 hypothetical protein [Mycolicibacterium madagascariense]BBZ25956.1 hypothetical protein MMAD_02510 [Mycolicibacterium madagascariense]